MSTPGTATVPPMVSSSVSRPLITDDDLSVNRWIRPVDPRMSAR